MSPHRLTFPPEPSRRRRLPDGYSLIALVVGAATVIAVLTVVLGVLHRADATTAPAPSARQLQATPVQAVAFADGQLLYEIRTEAFRAGYQAAIEREGCAPGHMPHDAPALGMPIAVHQLLRGQP